MILYMQYGDLYIIGYMALASKAALSRRALLSACLWCTPHSH